MTFLVAHLILHGELHKAAVVELSEEGELLSWAPLSSFPAEPANTIYRELLQID